MIIGGIFTPWFVQVRAETSTLSELSYHEFLRQYVPPKRQHKLIILHSVKPRKIDILSQLLSHIQR